MSGITFTIPGAASDARLLSALDRQASLHSLCRGGVEQFYDSDARLVSCNNRHPFAQAAHDAFYKHCPLVLSPDAVWHCLAQGFALHVKRQGEALRHAFVAHEGRLRLTVARPDFLPGRKNPWPEAFAAFSQQIAAHLGPLHGVLVADFSTTGPVERAASEILLMDAFQGFFEYEMFMGCGIPSFTLLGTVDDWRSIRRRAAVFAEYGMAGWVRLLLPVLDQFVAAVQGRPDTAFWASMFRYESGSGPAEMTGWINLLFPIIHDHSRSSLIDSPFMADWQAMLATGRQQRRHRDTFAAPVGPAIGQIPSGLNRAPVRLSIGTDGPFDAAFIGGMFGVVQDESTFALRPEFGWAVAAAS